MYKIDCWRENLYVIFGTKSLFIALVVPNDRILPLRGLEWSFMNLTGNKNINAGSIELTNKKNDDTDNLI
jgi:hypothetical protein